MGAHGRETPDRDYFIAAHRECVSVLHYLSATQVRVKIQAALILSVAKVWRMMMINMRYRSLRNSRTESRPSYKDSSSKHDAIASAWDECSKV